MINIDDLLVAARLILIVVFIFSGIAKLTNRQGLIDTLINFGIPSSIHKAIGVVMPCIELSIAVFLILPSNVWLASVAASILLAAFTVLITYNLIQGKHPSCNCFGVNNKPISALTVLRNVSLIACSFLIVTYGPQYDHASIVSWFRDMTAMLEMPSMLTWLLAAFVSVEGWIILKLIRQHGRLILRMDNLELRLDAAGIENPAPSSISTQGLQIGTLAPSFSLPNLSGDIVSLDNLLAMKKPILLVFSNPACGPCTAMIPSLTQWESELKLIVTLVLISRGTVKENLDKFTKLQSDNILLQTDQEMPHQYKIIPTPSAIRINIDGVIDSHIASGELYIASLVHESISHFESESVNKVMGGLPST